MERRSTWQHPGTTLALQWRKRINKNGRIVQIGHIAALVSLSHSP